MSVKLISNPVELKPQDHPRIKVEPKYFLQNFSDERRVFMQEESKRRLLNALESLPEQYGFIVWDAYRSRKVQGVMFNWMKEQVRMRDPKLSDNEVHEEARKFMTPPSKVGDSYIPPHLSGGAIDLTLFDLSTGKEILMGTHFDDCSEVAQALYYENKPVLDEKEQIYKTNRNILRDSMLSAGFTVYQHEWWHFDYGNVFWAAATGMNQIFGPLFGALEGPKLL